MARPRNWFAVAFFGVLAFVILRRAPEPATVEPMPTVAAKKKPARKAPSARKPAPFAVLPRRTPPPVAFTAGDLLKRKDFGKGLDGAFVESAVADRAL